jgi:Restriction endonuclease S subunits
VLRFRWETEFKETEIGEIPREWEVYPLSEVVEDAIVGSTPLKKISKYWANGTIPWLTNKEVEYGKINYIEDTEEKVSVIALEETNLRLVPPNSLIISFTASVGKVVINKVPITTNQQFISFVLKSIPDTVKYLGYFFLLNRELIESFSGATPFSFITKEKALQIPIIFPPLSEQSRIATVLSWFDDLIEVKKRQNEILEKTAMAIFKSWFIDFEPFMDGEFVYSEELGKEIPKGWEVKKLGEVVKTQYGVTISGENFGEIKLLRITDINKTFVIDWDNVPYCNIDEKTFYKYNLSDKDIVISRIADIGKVAIIENPPRSVFASYLIRLKIKSGSNIMPYYLYYWLKSEIYQEYILGAAEGSTRENTNAEVIKDGPILIPDISILQKFEEIACDLRSKIILNQKQIMTLRKIRDTLLPLLVFGKLRVEEV